MDQALNDPWLGGLASIVLFGSVATWIYIVSRWLRQGEVLPWEPRRPVPWGPAATILGSAFALMAISSAWGSSAEVEVAREPSAQRIAFNISSLLVLQLLMAGGFFAMIAVYYGVTVNDLGLPCTVRECLRDAGLGIAVCFAALLPVRIVQGLMMWLMGRPNELSQHPLIETLMAGGGASTAIMLLAGVSAVVVAPICEETTFRLLLQAWLEKWDGRKLPEPTLEPLPTDENLGQSMELATLACDDKTLESVPPRHGALGLPYGWAPIFISSFLFGIAHFGYGPEPIPLFVFAVFLGYAYQRTHRILPCIVAHGLFNLVSMLALWRIIVHASEHGG
jgi:membrane protease YdiL (CAAX protease family)